MKTLGKFIFGALLLLNIVTLLAIGVMFLQTLEKPFDMYQFWFVALSVVFGAASLFVHFTELIGFKKEKNE